MDLPESTQKEIDEIKEMIPGLSVDQLDSLGHRLETQQALSGFAGDRQTVQTLEILVKAVNVELQKRGLAIRPQDRAI